MSDTSMSISSESALAERQRRSRAAGQALLSGWRASGLSMRDYARQIGVKPQRISYWRLRLAGSEVPVPAAEAGFVELTASMPSPGVVVEVGSARVRVAPGFDPGLLSAVVSALSRPDARC